MKRIIRHKKDRTYLTSGAWISDIEGAQEFHTRHCANEEVKRYGLKDVELYLMPADRPSLLDWTINLA